MALTLIFVAIAIFLVGISAGVVVVVSLASRREDRDYSIKGPAPTLLIRGARVLTGLYVCDTVSVTPVVLLAERKTTLTGWS
jgi:formate-dependent nitrite reductase membrane component NrfD